MVTVPFSLACYFSVVTMVTGRVWPQYQPFICRSSINHPPLRAATAAQTINTHMPANIHLQVRLPHYTCGQTAIEARE